MNCKELKAIMDSYISDELLVETNHEVLRHLENCAACRGEMAHRRSLKKRLYNVIRNNEMTRLNPNFSARLTTDLREMAFRPSLLDMIRNGSRSFNIRVAAVGFASLLIIIYGGFVLFNRSETGPTQVQTITPRIDNRNAPPTPDSSMAGAVRVSWQKMTDQAVGDHKNCAIEFHLTEKPMSLDLAAKNHGAYNKDLDKAIKAALQAGAERTDSGETEFIEAHSCVFEGRRFAHIVVRHKGRIVSLLVTDTDLPVGDDDVQTAHFDGLLNTAGFRIGHHAVFVVSDLENAENVTLAKMIVPAIRLHGEKVGA